MGWESRKGRGRYYTRSVKVSGCVRREYVGGGPAGELAAARDEGERRRRKLERQELRARTAQLVAVEQPLAALCDLAETLARVELVAAGYRRHDRGDWRRRRERTS